MRGILWKWLFSFGLILWMALCMMDYYKKHIEKHPEFTNLADELILQPNKAPPALTFWKTLSMVLSVGALVYIKRSSSIKKYSKTNLMITYPIHELNSAPKIFNYCTELKKTQISPDLYSHEPSKPTGFNQKIPSIIGVEIVQKKLENLEKTVANLKQRHHGTGSYNSTSGIVSGSPEFRKFLTNCQPFETISEVSMTSSQCSESLKNVETTSSPSSECLVTQSVHQVPEKSADIKSSFSNNFSGQTGDSSWSTISEDAESNPEPEVVRPALTLTDILQVKETFSNCSKASETSGGTDVLDSDDDLRVPGSNLISSSEGTSVCSSTTLLSSSSNHLTSFLGESSSCNFEDDVLLNTLD